MIVDITELEGQQNNPKQEAATAHIDSKQKLTAEDFNLLVSAVQKNQQRVVELKDSVDDLQNLGVIDVGTKAADVAIAEVTTYMQTSNIRTPQIFKWLATDGSSTLAVCIARLKGYGWVQYLFSRGGIERRDVGQNGKVEKWETYGGVLTQTTGNNDKLVMSQQAVTNALANKQGSLLGYEETTQNDSVVEAKIECEHGFKDADGAHLHIDRVSVGKNRCVEVASYDDEQGEYAEIIVKPTGVVVDSYAKVNIDTSQLNLPSAELINVGDTPLSEQLPTIVNDLTTGGADKVLSAEMGKSIDEKLTELESKTIGKTNDFTISYTAQYQQQKLERTIFKGSRILFPEELIFTGRTNSSDSNYQRIKNGFIADRDINFLKTATYVGEVNIRVEHVNNVLLPTNVDYCITFPARKSGSDNSSDTFAGYVINLAGLFELGVRFVKFKASSFDPLQEQTDGNIIPAIVYTNDGVELEVLSDSSYNLLRRSTLSQYSTYWFRVPITADSSVLRVSYGLQPTSAGVNSHVFIPIGVYLELENIEGEEIDILTNKVNEIGSRIDKIITHTTEEILNYTQTYQTLKLLSTIKKGSTIRLSRGVKVTCRTDLTDTTNQTVTDGAVADRDINYVKSSEFTGELVITSVENGEIDNLTNEVHALQEELSGYKKDTQNAKEGSGIAYREMSRCGLRPIKILGVGNSWTGNATLYLGNILNDLGLSADISTSYAGSATLEMYNNNISNPIPIFTHRRWNKNTGSWDESDVLPYENIFMSEDWDIVTHQQQSARAGKYDTFQPYLNNIIDWEKKVSRVSPLIAMHATWAYPNGYDNAMFEEYYGSDTTTMYNALLSAYNQAMTDEKISLIFPSAPMIQQVRTLGIESIDTPDGGSHLSTNGCFAASCVWVEMLLRYYYYESVSNGKSITDSSYKPSSLSEEQASQIRALAVEIVDNVLSYFPNVRK